MQQFVIAHNYSPAGVKVVKPVKSANYAEVVDPVTCKLFASTILPT